MDNAEGCLNISWKGTVAYGNKAEFAEFKVDRIVGKGKTLEVENLVSSK